MLNPLAFLCIFLAYFFTLTDSRSPFDTPDPNPIDSLAIRQALSRYALAIDTKSYDQLSNVFLPTVVADYGYGILRGLPAVQTFICSNLKAVDTHHDMTTHVIVVNGRRSGTHNDGSSPAGVGATANSSLYFTAGHFGRGATEGQFLYAYGRYEDLLLKTKDGWKVKDRQVLYMGPLIGNVAIIAAPAPGVNCRF